MRPLIGITMNGDLEDNLAKCTLGYDYIKAVELAGGVPVLIPVIKGAPHIERYISIIDGLVITGGADVAPQSYGEEALPELGEIEIHRDKMELKLFREAREWQMPILGICRGAQIINVAMGGTLYQDIYSQLSSVTEHSDFSKPRGDASHTVKIVEHTKLKRIFSEEIVGVNSFHHQAVKELAPGLIVNALSTDGIIEGIESIEDRFIVGVQWHPENMVDKHFLMKELFIGFISMCKD